MSDLPPRPPRPRKIPPHILRRRRIVAVIILLLILALLGWGIWALIGLFLPDDDDQSSPQPQPTVTETVAPSPEASEDDDADDEQRADACDPAMLTITGATDQASYGADETPEFTLTVNHDGDVLCDASLGSDQQNFLVADAAGDFVFSTRACQVDPQEQIVEMEPGQSEEVVFAWERVGTDEECETIVDDVEPGEYQLVVAMGDREAEPVRFELEED